MGRRATLPLHSNDRIAWVARHVILTEPLDPRAPVQPAAVPRRKERVGDRPSSGGQTVDESPCARSFQHLGQFRVHVATGGSTYRIIVTDRDLEGDLVFAASAERTTNAS